jgi:hypothetical protein
MCSLTTPLIDKFIETRTEKENVPRHNDEEIVWNEGRGRNGIIYGNVNKYIYCIHIYIYTHTHTHTRVLICP